MRLFYGDGVLSAYLLSIAGTVVVAAIVTAIASEGKTAALVKTAAKLACLLVVSQPIASYFVALKKGQISAFFDKTFSSDCVITIDESFIKYCSGIRIDDLQLTLERELFEKYALTCSAQIEWVLTDEYEILLTQITLKVGDEYDSSFLSTIAAQTAETYAVKTTFVIENKDKKGGESDA